MQVQKPEVRQRIVDAARDEFFRQGYKKASMRAIARMAKITPGNIYAYYGGKEQLFEAVVGPVAEQMRRLCNMQFTEMPLTSLAPVSDELVRLYLPAKKEFSILFYGAEGSPYGNSRDLLTDLVTERIEQWLLPQLPPREQSPLLARAWSGALVEGLLVVFNNFSGNEEQLRQLLSAFLHRLFFREMP